MATMGTQCSVLLQMEMVKSKGQQEAENDSFVFWDSGSMVSLIQYSHARKLSLHGARCVLLV